MHDTMIDRIYEAAALPELWTSVLDDLSKQNGFVGGVLFTDNVLSQHGVCSPGVKDAFDIFIRDGWTIRNPRGRRAIERDWLGFGRSDDLFAPEEKLSEPIFTQLLHPHGLDDAAGTIVKCPNGDVVVLSFERAAALGRTPESAIQALDLMRPHIARAAVVSGRLDIERSRAQVSALQALGLPAAVVTASGKALAVNDGFEAFSDHARIGAFDALSLTDTIANRQLCEVLGRPRDATPIGRSIALRSDGSRPAAVLHVLPVRRAACDVFTSASWLLAVTPVGDVRSPDIEIIGALFDLTPAEARVVKALSGGSDLKEIAEGAGLSASTVRNQLASAFAKTGTSRQTELVLLCSGHRPPDGSFNGDGR